MPSSSSQSPSKEMSNVVITPDATNSTSTSQKSSDDYNQSNRYDDTYRKHMRGQLDDIIMEYISNDTDVTPYDFISDLKTSLYELQDYFQGNLNRVNAIIAYLNNEQSPHLFDRRDVDV